MHEAAILNDNLSVLAAQLMLLDHDFYRCTNIVESKGALDASLWRFLHPDPAFNFALLNPPTDTAAAHSTRGHTFADELDRSEATDQDKLDFAAAVARLDKVMSIVDFVCPA
jgi:hypothetical protein